MSLKDVVSSVQGKKASVDTYLGLLCPTEDYKVFGYITNSKIKLIMLVDDLEVKEAEIKQFFRVFHSKFADAVCNPFYVIDQPINSKRFDMDITNLVKSKALLQ
ncbi:trafficking protein particle complex subunit 2-like protein [Planoprotostelium fungivorum]|uniref:Trafficking protein particle complex subunit 2-like protein n=1 Tax=Planoprotostelium fungivorum TaxID=1890364 RepID=A0A2P6NM66_9EUKA|nr:trafficking protein particle complex subunit 2-like protein [Planoprotostelium fungivorum]